MPIFWYCSVQESSNQKQQIYCSIMHNIRKTKKIKIPIIEINPQENASQNLIEISTRLQYEEQPNEADLFARELSPRNNPKQLLQIKQVKTTRKQNTRLYSGTESKPHRSFTQRLSTSRQKNCKTESDRSQCGLSTIKLVYMLPSFDQKKTSRSKQKCRQIFHSKYNDNTFFTFKSSKSVQKYQKIKKRLAKGVSKQIVSAFQIKNIKLQNRYESYINQFKSMKQ